VIHTAGPFQGQEYGVARAAIAAGCHYVDLADGRDFVSRIGILDADAKARGVTVVSGASSVLAPSSAVVDRYRAEFDRLESIQIGISFGARAPGLTTVRGVFSYAGKPVRSLRDGSWTTSYGWRDLALGVKSSRMGPIALKGLHVGGKYAEMRGAPTVRKARPVCGGHR